jgi:hypothetical protein
MKMKIKTEDLTGEMLDCTVATLVGWRFRIEGGDVALYFYNSDSIILSRCYVYDLPFSSDWALGGHIIEDERIGISSTSLQWNARIIHTERGVVMSQYGATPLVAAMRVFVASKLGDEVEIPDELVDNSLKSV